VRHFNNVPNQPSEAELAAEKAKKKELVSLMKQSENRYY
jgi:hypothetical protein